MTFKEFMEIIDNTYSWVYVSKSLLYNPNSRILKIAKKHGYTPSEEEKTAMRYLIAGKVELAQCLFE